MLSDFAEKKEIFFDYKKTKFIIYLKSKKSAFRKGLTHAFGQQMPFLSLVSFGQKKTTNNA